jgi:Glycosyl transferase family 2
VSASLWLPERPVEVAAGSGTVAVCAAETARYSAFAASLAQLVLPLGWAVRFLLGSDLVASRNRAVRELASEWLLFLDDDHECPPDLIARLLAHEREIVGCLHVDRNYPCVEPTPEGPPGLYEVEVVGAPGMLVHRRVFERVDPPFRYWETGANEDFDSCVRAREAGFAVWQDTTLTPSHITPAIVTAEHEDGAWFMRLRIAGSEWRLEANRPGEEGEA